jgi:hypothetical protein
MLQLLEEHIQRCYGRATECAEEAKTETDKKQKASLLGMEQSWLHLAKSYEFVQSLELFLLDSHNQKKERQE